MTTTTITKAIQGQIPTLAAIYKAAYRNAFERYTTWQAENPRRDPAMFSWIAGDAQMARRVTSYVGGMRDSAYLDEETLTRVAERDATALAAAYARKVEGKAEGMTGVEVTEMNASGEFIVTGTKAGHAVEIRQSIVTKCSPKGTWFHQFPALVYITGRKSTEKALKAL